MTPDERNQAAIWNAYANAGTLQSTIDPRDTKGLKCRYIDRWSRYYIGRYLQPNPEISILEIGCGSGRNLLGMHRRIGRGYGVDIASEQIANANRWKDRLGIGNVEFSDSPEAFLASPPRVDAMFSMWVLAGFQDDDAMVSVVRSYVEALPDCRRFVLFEQVANRRYDVFEGGGFYKRVRTTEEYGILLERAGLSVRSHATLPEKGFGPLYRLLFTTSLYRFIPSWLDLSPLCFPIDRLIVDGAVRDTFTDGVFVCERQ